MIQKLKVRQTELRAQFNVHAGDLRQLAEQKPIKEWADTDVLGFFKDHRQGDSNQRKRIESEFRRWHLSLLGLSAPNPDEVLANTALWRDVITAMHYADITYEGTKEQSFKRGHTLRKLYKQASEAIKPQERIDALFKKSPQTLFSDLMNFWRIPLFWRDAFILPGILFPASEKIIKSLLEEKATAMEAAQSLPHVQALLSTPELQSFRQPEWVIRHNLLYIPR